MNTTDMVEKTDKCAHPACYCAAPVGRDYCSDYCENAASEPTIECRCGHAECRR